MNGIGIESKEKYCDLILKSTVQAMVPKKTTHNFIHKNKNKKASQTSPLNIRIFCFVFFTTYYKI